MYQVVKGIENTGPVLEKFILGHASGMNNQTALASAVKKSTIHKRNYPSIINLCTAFLDSLKKEKSRLCELSNLPFHEVR